MVLATFSLLPLILFLASAIVLALLSVLIQDVAAWWCLRHLPTAPPETELPVCPAMECCASASELTREGENLYLCRECGTRFEWFDVWHWRILQEPDATDWQEGPIRHYWPGTEPRANVEAGAPPAWDWGRAE